MGKSVVIVWLIFYHLYLSSFLQYPTSDQSRSHNSRCNSNTWTCHTRQLHITSWKQLYCQSQDCCSNSWTEGCLCHNVIFFFYIRFFRHIFREWDFYFYFPFLSPVCLLIFSLPYCIHAFFLIHDFLNLRCL